MMVVGEIVREIIAGVNGADSFSSTRFAVPNISDSELARALNNLEFDDGSLNYSSE